MRLTRTSGSVEHKTHIVTPTRPLSPMPIIGVSALLQLVEWCQLRRQKGQPGGPSCVVSEPPLSPPPDPSSPSSRPAPLWTSLTVEAQKRILVTLSRIVVQQLVATSAVQEVTNEPS